MSAVCARALAILSLSYTATVYVVGGKFVWVQPAPLPARLQPLPRPIAADVACNCYYRAINNAVRPLLPRCPMHCLRVRAPEDSRPRLPLRFTGANCVAKFWGRGRVVDNTLFNDTTLFTERSSNELLILSRTNRAIWNLDYPILFSIFRRGCERKFQGLLTFFFSSLRLSRF